MLAVLGAVLLLVPAALAANQAQMKERGIAFLKAVAKNPEMIILPSGLQYRVLKAAKPGAKSPHANSLCLCHYEGKLVTGRVFDSSFKRGQPAVFSPNQVIRGWSEAMQLMGEGDLWELFIPYKLAYGERQRGEYITPGSALVFKLELIEVKGRHKPKPPQQLPTRKDHDL